MSEPFPETQPSLTVTFNPVTVVGGTYRESCVEPRIDAIRGSGLRAAALLSSLGNPTALHTCVDEQSKHEAAANFDAFALNSVCISVRPTPVTFRYDTPISPARWGYGAGPQEMTVEASDVVAFGMVDATWSMNCARLVLDPQHADPAILLAGVAADAIALVLNAHEARHLTGDEIDEAGPALLSRKVDVVVIKQGALGGKVFSSTGAWTYGPVPTISTRTIGSGDAFTAGFAHAWFADPTDPLAAAKMGARVAAAHSMTDVPQVTAQALAALPEALDHPGAIEPRIYLAAPFFSTAERLLVETVRDALIDAGLGVFSPLHEIGPGGDEVAMADLDGVESCHAVLALLDGGDPGTVFEAGWATHAGIPVVGFTDAPLDHEWTMLRGTGTTMASDLTSALHLAAWAAIRHSTGTSTSSSGHFAKGEAT